MSVNKVTLVGNLGKDPIMKRFDNGTAAAQFTLATNERYKDKTSGETITKTEWHNIVMYSPIAEIAEKYLRKGNQVYLEGKIESRDYTDKDGIQKRFTEIRVRDMTLLGGPSGNSGSQEMPPPAQPGYVPQKAAPTSAVEPVLPAMEAADDLPF